MTITAADEEYYIRLKEEIEEAIKKGDEIYHLQKVIFEKYGISARLFCDIIFELIAKERIWKADVFRCFHLHPVESEDVPDSKSVLLQEISWTPPEVRPIDISDSLLESFDSVKVAIAQHALKMKDDGRRFLTFPSPDEITKWRESGIEILGRKEDSVVMTYPDDSTMREIICNVVADVSPNITEEIKTRFFEVALVQLLSTGAAAMIRDTPELLELWRTVKRYHDDIYFLIADIERVLHRNVLRVLLKLHGPSWYMSLARDLREDLARRYEYVREPMRVPESGWDLFPGKAELSLYEQATFGELRQIMINQWSDFRKFVPNALNRDELENQFRFLLQTRNAVAHRTRDHEFPIEDFRRLLKIREQMQPSNWRFG